jgi:putative acetyltransferase
MIKIVRTNSENVDFIELVKYLDADLAERDGEDHDYYDQFNKLDGIKHAVILYDNKKPLGCGAIKEYEPHVMEIKRMYTLPESRGKGFANKILSELEK